MVIACLTLIFLAGFFLHGPDSANGQATLPFDGEPCQVEITF